MARRFKIHEKISPFTEGLLLMSKKQKLSDTLSSTVETQSKAARDLQLSKLDDIKVFNLLNDTLGLEENKILSVFKNKVQDKYLNLDNTLTSNESKDKIILKRNLKKRKSKTIPKVERKKLSVVPKELEYEKFIGLNAMWETYSKELLGLGGVAGFPAKLVKADLHGALITGNIGMIQ